MRGPDERWIMTCQAPRCRWRFEGPRRLAHDAADLHFARMRWEHPIRRERVRVEIPPIDFTINLDDGQFRRILDDAAQAFARAHAEANAANAQWRRAGSAWGQGMATGSTPNATPGLQALGLAPGATAKEVRSRYRAKLREIHPDAGGHGDGKAMVRLQEDYARALREAGG